MNDLTGIRLDTGRFRGVYLRVFAWIGKSISYMNKR